jgi:hypothetical protein
LDTAVSVSGATLTASSFPGQTLQWVDCNNGFAPIGGATNQTFSPAQSGSYAVVVTGGFGCTDTSACRSVIVVGVEESMSASWVTLFPNPAHDRLTVQVGNMSDGIAEILDAQGRLMHRIAFAQNEFVVDCQSWNSGIYFIRIATPKGSLMRKFAVE